LTISKQAAELHPPVEAKARECVGHKELIQLLMAPQEEEDRVDLWSWVSSGSQPKENMTELVVGIQKEPAKQHLMRV
jgi:hypothetical protein